MSTIICTLNDAEPYFHGMLSGVRRYAKQAGWRVLSDWRFDWEKDHDELATVADGLIVAGAREPGGERVLDFGLPAVGVVPCDGVTGVPRVVPDVEATARVALDHFQAQGVEQFGLFHTMDEQNVIPRRRAAAFSRAARALGCAVAEFPNGPRTSVRWTLVDQILDLRDWLSTIEKPIGIFCGDDEHSARVCIAAAGAGLDVPRDIAVLGYWNNAELCERETPTLSSIDLDQPRIGYAAAALLDRLMHGETSPDGPMLIPPRGVVMRASTDRRYVEYPLVQRAVRYVEANISESFNIADLCRHVGVSRTYLNDEFRAATGRSTWDHVRHVRLTEAARLARETDLTLARIAAAVGYGYESHLSRELKAFAGVGLRELRRGGGVPMER